MIDVTDSTSKIFFVGDLCLARGNYNDNGSLTTTFQQWHNLTNKADLTIANLESCLVSNVNDCNRFMAVPVADSYSITELGIDVFSLANNHIMDCGENSLHFAMSHLHDLGIATVGAGKNIEEASAPLIINKNGIQIGIIGATDATHYKASAQHAGISTLSLKRMKKLIKQIINEVDLVVLCIHSDLEFTNYPAPWKVRLSRKLAKAGADIIVHHHPHTLQGVEIYEGSLIAYSLGNFIFPVHDTEYMKERDGNVDEGLILEVSIKFSGSKNKKISYNLIPTVINESNITHIADKDKANNIIMKMSEYNTYLNDWRLLRKMYLQLCLRQANNFVWGTYYTLCRNGILGTYKYLHTHFSTRMHRNWMRGILTLGWF